MAIAVRRSSSRRYAAGSPGRGEIERQAAKRLVRLRVRPLHLPAAHLRRRNRRPRAAAANSSGNSRGRLGYPTRVGRPTRACVAVSASRSKFQRRQTPRAEPPVDRQGLRSTAPPAGGTTTPGQWATLPLASLDCRVAMPASICRTGQIHNWASLPQREQRVPTQTCYTQRECDDQVRAMDLTVTTPALLFPAISLLLLAFYTNSSHAGGAHARAVRPLPQPARPAHRRAAAQPTLPDRHYSPDADVWGGQLLRLRAVDVHAVCRVRRGFGWADVWGQPDPAADLAGPVATRDSMSRSTRSRYRSPTSTISSASARPAPA